MQVVLLLWSKECWPLCKTINTVVYGKFGSVNKDMHRCAKVEREGRALLEYCSETNGVSLLPDYQIVKHGVQVHLLLNCTEVFKGVSHY